MTVLQASLVALAPDAMGGVQFADWRSFVESGQDASGFVLAGFSAAAQDELLWHIRRSAWWNAWIALSPDAPPSRFECLADARQEPAAALREIERMAGQSAEMAQHMDFEERLLHFLMVRDGARLQPVCDRHSLYLYRYPLAEALGANEDQVTRTLLDLQRRRVLAPDPPVDRVRHCTRCSSAHPHYYDVCPNCHSIQIAKTASCHCFACGHVGPEREFMQGNKLVCPQCHAALRHIGVDYDRPLNQYACADCRHVFMEPAVQVRCLDCGNIEQPDALDVRTIAPLYLSARGRAELRQGATDTAHGMPFASFRQVLAWTLANARTATLTLLVLDFGSASTTANPMGERHLRRMNEAMRRVNEMLHDADLSAVDAAHRLWLLVTDADHILARAADMRAPGGPLSGVAQLSLAAADAPRSMTQLLARVEAELVP